MKTVLFEARHLSEAGFFRTLFRALKGAGAEVSAERPFPSANEGGRHHEGAWARIGGALVFFDMSDHVFDFDRNGLEKADLYLKANLNRCVADRVLGGIEGGKALAGKLRPFTFLPPSLPLCRRIGRINSRRILPARDLFHVVGVYENPPRDGVPDPFGEPGTKVPPHVMHFWIRYHFSRAIQGLPVSARTRLTSRGNRSIEDGGTVRPNLNHQIYLLEMARSGFTVLNTFPHAVYPWKALESVALGRPFVLEREPLIDVPEAFRLRPGEHFLEVLPGFGGFDGAASLGDPASYRILDIPHPEAIRKGFETVAAVCRDRDRMEAMGEACRMFARERLTPGFLMEWLRKEVSVG